MELGDELMQDVCKADSRIAAIRNGKEIRQKGNKIDLRMNSVLDQWATDECMELMLGTTDLK